MGHRNRPFRPRWLRRWLPGGVSPLIGATALLLAVAVPAGAAGAAARPQVPSSLVRLPGGVPAPPPGSRVSGPASAGSAVALDLSLRPRNPSALAAFIGTVTDPAASGFRRYLAPGAFGPEFGPAPSTIASARAWLAAEGLHVGPTAPDRLLIPVSGTTGQVERAFGLSVEDVTLPSGRVALRPSGAPLVPRAIAPALVGLVGLDTVSRPHAQPLPGTQPLPRTQPAPSTQPASGPGVGPQPCAAATSLQPSGYTANQLAGTYGFSGLYSTGRTGAGETVGVYELEPFTPSDVSAYEHCYGLSVPVHTVDVDGGATGLQTGEAALDIEDVAGLAPGAAVEVYSGPVLGSGPIDTYARMVDDDSASVITTSWGQCEPQMDPVEQATETALFEQAAAQGQTVVAASGDSGSSDCLGPTTPADTSLQVDDPADQPLVTGVGGTSLLAAGSIPTETAWNAGGGAGGGGVSSDFAQPGWQGGRGVGSAVALAQCGATGQASCREVPDVSASADPSHGYVIYFGGGWTTIGGTSGAAPLWAALVAVVDQGLASPVGFVNPALYACGAPASMFHDVTSGTNDLVDPGGPYYPATAGYDLATGWGSPNAPVLAAELAAPPICPEVLGLSRTSGPLTGGGSIVVTGAYLAGAQSVRFGATAAPFTVDSPSEITVSVPPGPAGGGSVAVTVSNRYGASTTSASSRYTYEVPGYWLVASDGGVFAFGSAGFYGSTGSIHLNQPIVGMAAT